MTNLPLKNLTPQFEELIPETLEFFMDFLSKAKQTDSPLTSDPFEVALRSIRERFDPFNTLHFLELLEEHAPDLAPRETVVNITRGVKTTSIALQMEDDLTRTLVIVRRPDSILFGIENFLDDDSVEPRPLEVLL